MERWIKDLAVIEEKYCHAIEGTDELTVDEHLMSLQENDDSCDGELDESMCHSGDISSPQINKDHEARMIERLRCIRRDYESNYKSMRNECLLTEDFFETDDKNANESRCQVDEKCDKEDGLTLYEWYISLTSQLSVIVIGKRYDSGDVWHTTPIAERVDECPIKLRTASGSLYTLDDEIDKRSMQKNNFPASITNQFRYGFPKSWQSLIWNYASQFGFDKPHGNISTKDEHSKEYEKYPPMQGDYMTGKRKFEIVDNLLDCSPGTTHLLPNKKTKIDVLREVFEVMDDPDNLVNDLSNGGTGNQKSTSYKQSGKRGRYFKHKDEEMSGSVQAREEEDEKEEGKEVRKDLMNSSRNKLLSTRDKSYKVIEMNKHESYMTLRSRTNFNKEIKNRREDEQRKKLVKYECTEKSLREQNMNGYYLRNRSIPEVKIENLKSHHTPTTTGKTAKPRCNGSSIKIRRKRKRGPRLVFGKPSNRTPKRDTPNGGTRNRGNMSYGSFHRSTLNEMKEEHVSRVANNKSGSTDPKGEFRVRRNESRDPKKELRDCRSESRNPRRELRNNRSDTRGRRSEPRDSKNESRDCRNESRDYMSESRDYRSESRGRRSEPRDSKNESRDYISESRGHGCEFSDGRTGLGDFLNSYSDNKKRKGMPSRIYLSSVTDSEIDKDLKGCSFRYNMENKERNKPKYKDLLYENQGSGEKIFASENREVSISGARNKKTDEYEKVKERERRDKGRKVLKPKIRVSDDWDKDIRFSSDENANADVNELHVYPRRIRNGREIVSKATSSDCTSSEEPVEYTNDRRRKGFVSGKRTKTKNMREPTGNSDKDKMKTVNNLDGLKRQISSGRNEVMIESCNCDTDEWNENEIERLQYAMCNFQPESNHYWQKVAYLVGAKSPATCQRKYEEMIYPINKEVVKKRYKGLIKKEREMKNLPDITDIKFNDFVTAKRGTLRRKKQLREFFEAYDHGYEDNIFDSTPFQNRKRTVKLPFDVTEVSGLISPFNELTSNNSDDSDCDTSGNTSCTVSSNDSALNSSSNLFQTNILIPASREPAEAYLYKLQKLRKSKPVASRTHAKATSDVQKSRVSHQSSRKLKSPSVAFHVGHNYSDFDQSHEEKDDYFEEEISD